AARRAIGSLASGGRGTARTDSGAHGAVRTESGSTFIYAISRTERMARYGFGQRQPRAVTGMNLGSVAGRLQSSMAAVLGQLAGNGKEGRRLIVPILAALTALLLVLMGV